MIYEVEKKLEQSDTPRIYNQPGILTASLAIYFVFVSFMPCHGYNTVMM
jgi:hypothetical protein